MNGKSSLELNLLFACRICLQQSKSKDLISPCKCKGSLQYIHKSCFISWIASKQNNLICELCQTHYRNIIIKSKSANFFQFIRHGKLLRLFK